MKEEKGLVVFGCWLCGAVLAYSPIVPLIAVCVLVFAALCTISILSSSNEN